MGAGNDGHVGDALELKNVLVRVKRRLAVGTRNRIRRVGHWRFEGSGNVGRPLERANVKRSRLAVSTS
jgi:hypothetical protein